MKILAIIPARSGSKRVPGKNTKILANLPLISHTIKAAQQSACCHTILVSTECQDIADIAVQSGASVPWLRPANLADDLSDVTEAVIDIINRYQAQGISYDSVLLLQPTSPFRTPLSIQQAVEIHKYTNVSVVSVSTPTIKPSWFKSMDNEGNLVSLDVPSIDQSSKNQYPLFQLNGSIYLASVQQIVTHCSFYSKPTKALVIENAHEAIDIDTPLDWALAEKVVEIKANPLAMKTFLHPTHIEA